MAFEKNLDKMGKLLSILDEEHLSKKDFAAAFAEVLKFSKATATFNREQIAEYGKQMQVKLQQLQKEIVDELYKAKSGLSNEEQRVKKEIESRFAKYEETIQQRLANLKDGESPEIEAIIQELKQYLPEPLEDLPIEGQRQHVRDLLEGIEEEKEKLAIDAIQDLRKELDALKRRPVGGGSGMDVSHWARHEAFTMNGSDTTVSLTQGIGAAGTACIVRWQGQTLDLGSQYTVSGNKITLVDFTPSVDDIISVTYWS